MKSRSKLGQAVYNFGIQIDRVNRHSDFFFDRALQLASLHHLAIFDEGNSVAGNLHLAKEMRVEQHGRAAFALGFDDVAYQAATHGIEADEPPRWEM